MTNYPEYLTQPPLDGLCQPSFDADDGSDVLSNDGLQKEVRVIEYGQTICVNPQLSVTIDKLFDKEFIKDKTLMGRSIYAARETDDCIRIIVYDRRTMAYGRHFAAHDFSVLLLQNKCKDAIELVESFDAEEYNQYVREFRKKYFEFVASPFEKKYHSLFG